jgi:hypothetical protein
MCLKYIRPVKFLLDRVVAEVFEEVNDLEMAVEGLFSVLSAAEMMLAGVEGKIAQLEKISKY